jgi:UDP-N-acetylglucosamine--N-acetylmuramyl-(pentapeptide) pyrophosphoryl-undecaprenol N-acetylglucosamine transferase
MFEFRPDIVIGFGTIDCLPLLLLAWIFRVKTLIHEQNVLPGRANRLLARFSDRIAISFEETREHLAAYEKKIVLTGNPIRKELEKIDRLKALGFFGFKEDKFTILVMGGSLGSQRINAAFLKAASLLTDTSGLQVIHITGIKDCELIKARYKDLNIESRVFGFLNSMQYAYSACDLVISRAGATSVTEIMFFGLSIS